MPLYPFLLFLHILLAIIAVGANFTYGVWLARARRPPEHLLYIVRSVQFLDSLIANPARTARMRRPSCMSHRSRKAEAKQRRLR